jgi:2-dehydro-3-deoxygalactonokinase
MMASASSDDHMTSSRIDCIIADWGTSNRRAWALSSDGSVLAERHDGQGLLAITDRRFAESFVQFCGDWLQAAGRVPIVMAGMVGSKLGWQEVPYQMAPIALRDLSRHLARIDDPLTGEIWIAPGIALDDGRQLEVMRGEECQVLGALLQSGRDDGTFLLPGTHSKWVKVKDGKIISFRTYMTGEVYGLLRKSGTLSQLMEGDGVSDEAFHKGVLRTREPDAGNLLHSLFSVRTLGLFDRLPRTDLPSYLSGLLIGAEIHDATSWLLKHHVSGGITAIGSPALLRAYRQAAASLEIDLISIDSDSLLPRAMLFLAKTAGILPGART